MILHRLLIRHRLNLLVAIPLAMVTLLVVPLLSARVTQARLARQTAQLADQARRVSGLIENVQAARLLAVGYLGGGLIAAPALNLQFAAVSDARAQLLKDLQGTASPALLHAIRGAAVVSDLGGAALARAVSEQEILGVDSSVVGNLIEALALDHQRTTSPEASWRLSGLLALLKADEAASQFGAQLLIAASSPPLRTQAEAAGAVAQSIERDHVAAFRRLASPSEVALFAQATQGAGAQRLADATAQVGLAGANAVQGQLASEVFSAVESQTTVRELVEATIAEDVAQDARSADRTALLVAGLLIALVLALLAIVVVLSVLIGRSVTLPLRRLTAAAGSVADLAQEELANVTDDAGPGAVRRLPELPVSSRDELGELAAAFNRVQATTGGLLERQIVGRRNVAAMFASIGRRTTNLVSRQLALIDALESVEDDTGTLRTLYRLDQLSTRLRRNASSLVVLSGDWAAGDEGEAATVPDTVRAALGSVEDFQRVALSALPEVCLSPGVTADVVLILSELIENGVLFSPPHTCVEVAARVSDDAGYTVTIVDHGIGMPPERLAEENARLRQRERIDLAPTDVLGLFVVGRLSRRHGIEVTLIGTPGGGVTARVVLPLRLFVDNPWSGILPPASGSARTGTPSAMATPPNEEGARIATVEPTGVGFPLAGDTWRIEPAPAPLVARAPSAPAAPAPPAGPAPSAPAAPAPPAGPAPSAPAPPAMPGPAPAAPAPSAPLRRRVPGTGESPPLPPRVVRRAAGGDTGEGSGADQRRRMVGRASASEVAAILDGSAPRAVGSADAPDPEATRRQVEDLEAALAVMPPADEPPPNEPPPNEPRPGTPLPRYWGSPAGSQVARAHRGANGRNLASDADAAGSGGNGPAAAPNARNAANDRNAAVTADGRPNEIGAVTRDGLAANGYAPRGGVPVAGILPDPGRPGGPPDRSAPPAGPPAPLVRRVPGATLAALVGGAAEPAFAVQQPVEIDAEETLRTILDVDEAVQRARTQTRPAAGHRDLDDAMSRWGKSEDGGGR